ncbi:hypothetical protein MAR_018485, partial [Mya arenaria]
MLSMEDMEETEIDNKQKASTSMAKHSPRIRSPRIHPEPEATNGISERQSLPHKPSTMFTRVDSSLSKQSLRSLNRTDPTQKNSENSKRCDSPQKDTGSSKEDRSSSKYQNQLFE